MKRPIFILVIFGIISFCPISWAYKAYVTDSFQISLREEDNIGSKNLKFLTSGQPIEVIETREGWSNVTVMDDDNAKISGWVLSRYLITSSPWKVQARQLRDENMRLMNEILSLEEKLKETASRENSFSEELKKSADLINTLKNRYDNLERDASGYINLKKEHEATKEAMNKLSSENEVIKSANSQRWFVTGVLVLLCGLLIGILMGRREKKLKSYY